MFSPAEARVPSIRRTPSNVIGLSVSTTAAPMPATIQSVESPAALAAAAARVRASIIDLSPPPKRLSIPAVLAHSPEPVSPTHQNVVPSPIHQQPNTDADVRSAAVSDVITPEAIVPQVVEPDVIPPTVVEQPLSPQAVDSSDVGTARSFKSSASTARSGKPPAPPPPPPRRQLSSAIKSPATDSVNDSKLGTVSAQ
jgi:hypothetical protein